MLVEQKRTAWAVGVLVLAGGAAVAGRLAWGQGKRPLGEEALWRLRYAIRFRGEQPPARIVAALPDNTASCRIYRESFSRAGLAMDVVRNPRTQGRAVVVLGPKTPGEALFTAEFDVRLDPSPRSTAVAREPLSEADRQHYLQGERHVQTDSPVVRRTEAALSKDDKGPARLLQGIYLHCCTAMQRDDVAGSSDAAGALEKGLATPLGRARTMIALCRVAGMPARPVVGFALRDDGGASAIVWVEVHDGAGWVPYDPERGYARDLPPHYLPVRRDGVEVVRKYGPANVDAAVYVHPIALEAGGQAPRAAAAHVLDLSRLPLAMQHTLAVLLLLPAGALLTSIFRNLVGMQTFGTFTPALLALSFLYSDFWTGLVVFVLVLAIGLGSRGLLDRLRLLMVPRLSVLLTIVVLCLAMAVSVLDIAGLTPSARAVILPLVIMTMMIERFHVSREEDGLGNALKMLAGTLAVAACCLLVLRWEELGRLALHFPECELFVAAALLLIGRYSGYRLSELVRFRDLAGTTGPGE